MSYGLQERVITRIAMAEDGNLEALLGKLFPLLLPKLAENSTAIRNKVCIDMHERLLRRKTVLHPRFSHYA